jgi:carbamoyltransferase
MKVLGISCFYHDSAICILDNNQILFAAQEERFSRKKNDASFPNLAIEAALEQLHLNLSDFDFVVFYEKPFLKFERIIETMIFTAPRSYLKFVLKMPHVLSKTLYLKKNLRYLLNKIEKKSVKPEQIIFSKHHMSHAASAFYPSPFDEAAILTIDGTGEWNTTTISYGKNNKIEMLKEMNFPHSWGLFYSAVTYFLGFKVNEGEYKVMGLAPYADSNNDKVQFYIKKIKEKLITIYGDGSIMLNLDYFDFLIGDKMVKVKKWEQLFGLKKRSPETQLNLLHASLALAFQSILEEGILKIAATAKKITGSKNLVLSGGVALNCVSNGNLQRSQLFENIWIQPAAGDAGGALGAAYLAYHQMGMDSKTNELSETHDKMKSGFLGTTIDDDEITNLISKYNLRPIKFNSNNELVRKVSELIFDNKVCGWIQGSAEWGPRSLGHRSILANALNPDMQRQLNLKIKFRESFRPFAPIVLDQDQASIFEDQNYWPYMLFTTQVKNEHLKINAVNKKTDGLIQKADNELLEKLSDTGSLFPAITHCDGSARVQTIKKVDNPLVYDLLLEIKKLLGYGVLVNTSFNVRGEPIVNTAEDAYRCFMHTEMDFLVINEYMFIKQYSA